MAMRIRFFGAERITQQYSRSKATLDATGPCIAPADAMVMVIDFWP